jgi:hypothetical protein
MAIYKEAAFKKYITYDVAIFIKEAKDIIIKAVIKSV